MSDKKKNINDASKEELIVIVKQLHTKLNAAMQQQQQQQPPPPSSSLSANHQQQLREYEERVASLTEQSRLLKLELSSVQKERGLMASQVQSLQDKSQADEETIRALIRQVEDGAGATASSGAHIDHRRRTSSDVEAAAPVAAAVGVIGGGAPRSVSPSTTTHRPSHRGGGGGDVAVNNKHSSGQASRVDELVLTVRGLEEALSEAQEKISDLTTYNEYWEKQEEDRRRRAPSTQPTLVGNEASLGDDAVEQHRETMPASARPAPLPGNESIKVGEREVALEEENRRLHQTLRQLRVDAQLQSKAAERYQSEAQELLSLCASLQRLVGYANGGTAAAAAAVAVAPNNNSCGSLFFGSEQPPLAASSSMAALPAVPSVTQLTDHSANPDVLQRTPGGGGGGSHHSDAGSSSAMHRMHSNKSQAATLFHASRPSPPHSVSGGGGGESSSVDHHNHHAGGHRFFSQRLEGGGTTDSGDAHARFLSSSGMAFIASLPAVQLRGATPREKKLMERMKLLEDHIKAADTFEATRKRSADEVEENRAEIMTAMRQQIQSLRSELAHAKKAADAAASPQPTRRLEAPQSAASIDEVQRAPPSRPPLEAAAEDEVAVQTVAVEQNVDVVATSASSAVISMPHVAGPPTGGGDHRRVSQLIETVVQTETTMMQDAWVSTDSIELAPGMTVVEEAPAVEGGHHPCQDVSLNDNFDVEEVSASAAGPAAAADDDHSPPPQHDEQHWVNRVAALESEIEALQAALDRHAQASEEREKRFRDATKAIQTVKQKAADAASRVTDLEGVRASLQRQLDDARTSLAQLQESTQLAHAHDVAVSAKYEAAWMSAHVWGSTMADMLLQQQLATGVGVAAAAHQFAPDDGSRRLEREASLHADVAWLEAHWAAQRGGVATMAPDHAANEERHRVVPRAVQETAALPKRLDRPQQQVGGGPHDPMLDLFSFAGQASTTATFSPAASPPAHYGGANHDHHHHVHNSSPAVVEFDPFA